MKKSSLFASKCGLLTLLSFIAFFGAYSDIPANQWLSHTFFAISFTFSFVLELPEKIAYALVIIVFILIFIIGYLLSKPMFKKLDH